MESKFAFLSQNIDHFWKFSKQFCYAGNASRHYSRHSICRAQTIFCGYCSSEFQKATKKKEKQIKERNLLLKMLETDKHLRNIWRKRKHVHLTDSSVRRQMMWLCHPRIRETHTTLASTQRCQTKQCEYNGFPTTNEILWNETFEGKHLL